MIKAGNHTVSDKGFTVVTENIGGVPPARPWWQSCPAASATRALAAFCAGPIEVLAEDGSTTATYTGPFRVVSHGLKLTRTSEDSDVAALTAQVAELEAKLSHEQSEKGKRPERPCTPQRTAYHPQDDPGGQQRGQGRG